MKLFAKAWLLIGAFIVASQSISAAEWRGIVPLHSSRADIVRLFNVCGDNKKRCFFSLEDQNVQVVFSGWQGAFGGCPRSIPKDTVLLVRVRFNKPMPIKELKINLKKFKAFDPSYPSAIGFRAYIDEKSGLLIKSYQGRVVEFDYIASQDDQAFCPRFYENPRDFVAVVQRQSHRPPTISLACPADGLRAGSIVTFLARTTEDYDSALWTLTEGRIVSGQGTREITVDTAGLGGRKITAMVEMTLEDDPYSFSAWCTVQILEESPN
ncbi:MAG: hypothetical protein M3447_00315 [Acidobacteriota bacterium]|nr:hypothetical protein [Acidobacteriota bacterium]